MIAAPFLCRDCLTSSPNAPARCARCGSPRGVAHPELDSLTIAHVDCDAFFASIEKRDDPSLTDRPVIIGGGRRGVVATACYVARTYGIHSAMPMFKALRACPNAVVIRPNAEKYTRVGRQVRAMMRELTPLVEPVSIDEAFLDLTGTERLHGSGAAETLIRLCARVEREIGITLSVGLSYNKFLAKVASDLDKPRGFSVIGRAQAAAFLAERPVSIIPGIGAVAAGKLERAGIRRIRDLAEHSPDNLARLVGRDGPRLLALARGEDPRPVHPERAARSVSAETTFATDLTRLEDLEPVLWRLCEKVAARLRASGLATGSVVLKLKTADFRTRTRTVSGLPPTRIAPRLFKAARRLLVEECDGSAFRLIGIGAAELCPGEDADRGDLADQDAEREARRESAIAMLRERFGQGAVQRGITLRDRTR